MSNTKYNISTRLRMCGAIACALFAASVAHAGTVCSDPTTCTLDLTTANSSSGFGTGSFGTVQLTGNGVDTVTITVTLQPDWDIAHTGFPGVIGFTDLLAGTPTIGNFSSDLYSGSIADASQDLHFDGFGYFNIAVGTTAPNSGSGVQSLSFTISQSGLSDVNDLLALSGTPAGDSRVYFTVDGGPLDGSPGLLGVVNPDPPPAAPEPGAFFLVGIGLIAISIIKPIRNRLPTSSRLAE